MTSHDDPREELLELAAELRHLRAEHLRTGVESSTRRHLETRMREVTYHFERRLEALVEDEGDREAWRHHAHGGPAPERPEPSIAVTANQTPPDRPTGRRPWPR
jgi:hypothetical protein